MFAHARLDPPIPNPHWRVMSLFGCMFLLLHFVCSTYIRLFREYFHPLATTTICSANWAMCEGVINLHTLFHSKYDVDSLNPAGKSSCPSKTADGRAVESRLGR